ncbi:MAG: tetratricopeptide repeat protein [Bacteroidales bacterium]|nr:tetratricopeptide repeat protein [Bacteroidales bacterium]
MRAKHRCTLIILLISLSALFPHKTYSAESPDNLTERFNKGVELYLKGLLESAEKEFESLLEDNEMSKSLFRSEIEGYITLIAIQSLRANLHSRYIIMEQKWPQSCLISTIRLKYGSHLFDIGDFAAAYEIFSLIDSQSLTEKELNEYYFKTGYANFRTGNPASALSLFGYVINNTHNNYTNPAIYYSAHIHYMMRDFIKAIDLFNRIGKDQRFSLLSRYYILESKFMLKEYLFVAEKGEELYDLLSGDLKTKCARVVSEAFFALENTEKAKFYFEKYSQDNDNLSRKDIYYAGILAYTQKNYSDAIGILKQVISDDDSLTQNASYHLGRCYIEIKNKFEALNSFRIASEGKSDLTIKEDALFNYAKLSFDLNSDITKFRKYLDTYSPPVEKFNEIQNYIASSYLVKQDYKSAIDVLRTIKNPSSREIVHLQKATFLRGMQLLNLGAYRDAVAVFELSLENGSYNSNLYNVTNFWLAEAYYRSNQFQRSVDINLNLAVKNSNFRGNREYPTSLYNLAYGYFKLANFEQAESWFKRYLSLPRGDILYLDEARTRLGDSYFMQRKYAEAIETFSLVNQNSTALKNYSIYQSSIANGLLGDDVKKAEMLKELISRGVSNTLLPEVLYELGRTLIQTGDNTTAVNYLTELSEKFINSHFYSKALLELGLISLNSGNENQAIDYYKKILSTSPKSPEAQSAVAGLENIYREMGRAEEFLEFIDGLGLSQSRSSSERELIVFSSAERQFISGNYASAVSSLNSFLKSYPKGGKAAQAWFYLGESLLKTGKPELAQDAFLEVMNIGDESFTELATLNYARISYQLENFSQAAKAYSTLGIIAKLENNKAEAQTGLMNSYFMDQQYQNAIAQAERAERGNLNNQDRVRVRYIKGKSYYILGERTIAIPFLTELAKNRISPEGAESAYLLISDIFDKGDFERVEREVYAFADSKTPQSYWLAKAYILLGDTFAERENWEQARATYNSILESYKPKIKDDIEEQIKMRLSRIEEKKSNLQ